MPVPSPTGLGRAEDAFPSRGPARDPGTGLWLRQWSVRHARLMAAVYHRFEAMLRRCAPLIARLGWARLERPFACVESAVKGRLFGCRMCSQCVLSETGLSCPMNCPKGMRNGPCGGVREDGTCEVHAGVPCVWVAAFAGARRLGAESALMRPLPPLDHRLSGRSAWLNMLRPAGP